MSDLISRQAAIDDIETVNPSIPLSINWVKNWIKTLPSEQPERKRGKWIFVRSEEAGNALYECSECGKGDIHAPEVRVSYCWNCGAQMEGTT